MKSKNNYSPIKKLKQFEMKFKGFSMHRKQEQQRTGDRVSEEKRLTTAGTEMRDNVVLILLIDLLVSLFNEAIATSTALSRNNANFMWLSLTIFAQ